MNGHGARGHPRAPIRSPIRSMQGLQLHPHVSFGLVASRPVFLDLERDRYIMLDPGSEADFLTAANGEPIVLAAWERLLATGLFRPADAAARILPAIISLPERSLLDEQRARPKLFLALRAYLSTARARRRLAREPLLSLLDSGPRRPPLRGSNNCDAGLGLARQFLASRPLVPIPPKCLQDSLALREWLISAGTPPSLVFGVRLDPFGAHCWLQSGSLLLNDATDVVASFTPVLVLE